MPLALTILTIPLIFWTLTANFFTTPKLIVIALLLLYLVGHSIYRLLTTGSLALPRSGSSWLYLAIIVGTLLNLTFVREGMPESIAGRAGLLLLLPLISLFVSSHPRPRAHITTSFFVVITLLSLHTLLQLTWLYQASFLPAFMQSRTFTPTGSFLTTLTLLLSGLAAALVSLRTAALRSRPFYLAIIFATTISSVAIISLMLPGSPLELTLLPLAPSWSIALDSLKNLRSILLGVGLANFPAFFGSVKPLALNATNLWNSTPQSSGSELLTLLTTGGLVIFLPFLLLILSTLRRATALTPLGAAAIVLALAFVFTPTSSVIYFFFFLLLPQLDSSPSHLLPLPPPARAIISGLIFMTTATLLYFLSRPVLADYYSRAGQVALAANDGRAVYEAHLAAVRAYPQLTSSRLAYAETNLRLASALSQRADLTENDRSTIATLIQQSIREGKAATALRPHYSLTWLALGKIYRQLINVATGADQFAVSAYAQAVALDPANPSLRIDFGGLLVQLGTTNLPRARTEFTTAIQLKSDYANAYYNLAKLLESEKDFAGSLVAMKKVATLLPPDSPDQGSIQAAIATLEKQLPAPVATPSALLSAPSPLPSPLPGGPLELNETP